MTTALSSLGALLQPIDTSAQATFKQRALLEPVRRGPQTWPRAADGGDADRGCILQVDVPASTTFCEKLPCEGILSAKQLKLDKLVLLPLRFLPARLKPSASRTGRRVP